MVCVFARKTSEPLASLVKQIDGKIGENGKLKSFVVLLNADGEKSAENLRKLARVEREVQLDVEGRVTVSSVLDALEARYPMLRGTIRDQVTQRRRPFVRFFACEEDLSHEPPDAPLPDAVATGAEPFLVVGAMSGG